MFDRIHRVIDRLISPPPDYSNYTYNDRIIGMARDIYHLKQPLRRLISLLRLAMMMMMAYILVPVSLILKIYGYRFVNIDLAQIGSVVYLDLLLREDKLTKKTPKHKILALASDFTDGNRYLLDLYNRHMIFVRNPFLKLLLSPFFLSPIFHDNSYKFGYVHHTETISHQIWEKYRQKNDDCNLIEMKESDIRQAEKLLKIHIESNSKFVTLHIRDNGFYNISGQITRNADINVYKKAIKYLISQGYYVIRLGDPNMDDISNIVAECGSHLFDYARSDIKSEMMDIYLLSQCAFFIGMASGPSSVPHLFGVNSCNINWCTASNAPYFMKGDLTTFKKYRYKKDNSLVPFKKLLEDPLSKNPNKKILDAHGIWIEDNDEEEIFDTVVEYIVDKGAVISDMQKKAKNMLLQTNFAYGAKGNYSNTILKKYFES